MKPNKVDKHYVSDIDQFLVEFNKQNPKLSTSQQEEVKKFTRIFRLRDNHEASEEAHMEWEGF